MKFLILQAYNNLAFVRDVNGPPIRLFGLDRPAQRGLYGGPGVSVFRDFRWETVGSETSFCNVNK